MGYCSRTNIVEQTNGKVLEYKNKESLKYNKKNLLNPWFIVVNKRYELDKGNF